jgi:hypothetical protein
MYSESKVKNCDIGRGKNPDRVGCRPLRDTDPTGSLAAWSSDPRPLGPLLLGRRHGPAVQIAVTPTRAVAFTPAAQDRSALTVTVTPKARAVPWLLYRDSPTHQRLGDRASIAVVERVGMQGHSIQLRYQRFRAGISEVSQYETKPLTHLKISGLTLNPKKCLCLISEYASDVGYEIYLLMIGVPTHGIYFGRSSPPTLPKSP